MGAAMLGSLREPLARLLGRLESRSVDSFVVLQVLNVADAVLTGLGLQRRAVTEANPVARLIGMPLKIVLVGIASWFVYRWRPRLLLVPIVALIAVLAYHIGGLVVNAR